MLDLGRHSAAQDISLTLDSGVIWFKAGVLSGPVMGAVGAWAGRRRSYVVARSVVAIVVCEPLAVYLASSRWFGPGDGSWNAVYIGEAALGLA